jgi:hypothetical protein
VVTASGLVLFLGGLVLGLFLGIILGPAIRLWITWHEWVAASREARLTEDVMKRMDARPWRFPTQRRAAGTRLPRSEPDAP